jgi:hypothetical protein
MGRPSKDRTCPLWLVAKLVAKLPQSSVTEGS